MRLFWIVGEAVANAALPSLAPAALERAIERMSSDGFKLVCTI